MMAHKRPRKGDDDDNGMIASSRLLSPFGQETIHEIEGGNTTFARGGFGELSIAIRSRNSQINQNQSQSQSLSPAEENNSLVYSLVAVKTIQNAITNGGSGGRFGGFGRSGSSQQEQEQQQQYKLSNEVLNELLALRLLQPHPNIVPLVAVYPGRNHGALSLSLAFPYSPMDMREVLELRRRTFRQPLAFRFLKTILRDVFEALAHCHDTGILHRDLKPGNLLVSSKGVIQLCDFGLAKPFLSFDDDEEEVQTTTTTTTTNDNNNNNNAEKGLCTLYYRPPEVLLGGPSAYPSVDSWSAGVVLTELISGRPLWPGRNVIDQLSLVYGSLGTPDERTWPSVRKLPDYGKLNFALKTPRRWEDILPRATETTSNMLVDLVSKLLALNPSQRLTARQALDHDWLKEENAATNESSSVVAVTATAAINHKELRDELILPTELQIPPLLFPKNRALVEKLGLEVAESRRSILSSWKKQQHCWQGPTLNNPLKFCDYS